MKCTLKYKTVLIIVIIVFSLNIFGCSKKQESKKEEKSKLNVYINIDDEYSLKEVNFIINEFQNANENVDVKFTGGIGDRKLVNNEENLIERSDIIFASRNKMIDMKKKGLLANLSDKYDENQIKERYYNVIGAYGRIGEEYYGIGLMPYSIEFLYNKDALRKLNISFPSNVDEWIKILKIYKDNGVQVPIVMNKEMEIENVIGSIIINSNVNMENITGMYDSGFNQYSKVTNMQRAFNIIHEFVRNGYFNNSIFINGDEKDIDRFLKGEFPLIISSSYYHNKFNESNIGIVREYYNNTLVCNIPVIVEPLLCVSEKNSNSIEVNNFIKFVLSDEFQNKLVNLGYITGNKKANREFTSLNKIIVEHINNASSSSILFTYNMPKKINKNIAHSIAEILKGRYTGKEWYEILKNTY
ncbi:hypothetical protein CLTEP_26000 [Clostridium tepidiprofundi DSM 19306]|uniref:Bacterial extracellular solute-binding protein n=1 Tax=Clostridium tepidiprofundi DSM 19306 TaxID=1121338 RepID=A0A151ASE7_9CLOT|nr:ABC transporter substrate-binding protein [Clostridium tepidiprofundi]KYH30512.1 hypothetical protein CLTEP_26000 [Clostridium tepidiprofundi DSM 19306]